MNAEEKQSWAKNCLILIPAFNEEEVLTSLVGEVRRYFPETPVLVVNDGSLDRTAAVARQAGAIVLDLPCNLGVGGAVQAGFQYALAKGYSCVVRIDGDGQHPPEEIGKLLEAMASTGADLIVGSRFELTDGCVSSRGRYLGIKALAFFLSLICRSRVTDPTSGFWALNRPLLSYFSRSYPADYPEPEALALLRRQGYSFAEVPVRFRVRQGGRSTIRSWGAFYYALKVGLALVVDRVRPINPLFDRSRVVTKT